MCEIYIARSNYIELYFKNMFTNSQNICIFTRYETIDEDGAGLKYIKLY